MIRQFLVFWVGDGCDSESNNVYYSCLVNATSEKNAIDKYVNSSNNDWSTKDPKYFGALEITDKNHIK